MLCAVLTITYVAVALSTRAKQALPLSMREALEKDRLGS
jgi:acyl-CoA thioester hydrolase